MLAMNKETKKIPPLFKDLVSGKYYSSMLLTLLLMSTLAFISSSSFLVAWIYIELNAAIFIALLYSKHPSPDIAMKYILSQAPGSIMLLMIFMMEWSDKAQQTGVVSLLLTLALIIKMGAAPAHLWFTSMMKEMSTSMCWLLSGWQKIITFVACCWFVKSENLIWLGFVSMIISSLGIMNQTKMKSLMAFSSIMALGVSLCTMSINLMTAMLVLAFYILFSSALFNSIRASEYIAGAMTKNTNTSTMTLLNMSGLPPFMSFIPKIMMIVAVNTKFPIWVTLTATILTIFSILAYMTMWVNTIPSYTSSVSPSLNMMPISPIKAAYVVFLFSTMMVLPDASVAQEAASTVVSMIDPQTTSAITETVTQVVEQVQTTRKSCCDYFWPSPPDTTATSVITVQPSTSIQETQFMMDKEELPGVHSYSAKDAAQGVTPSSSCESLEMGQSDLKWSEEAKTIEYDRAPGSGEMQPTSKHPKTPHPTRRFGVKKFD